MSIGLFYGVAALNKNFYVTSYLTKKGVVNVTRKGHDLKYGYVRISVVGDRILITEREILRFKVIK